MLYLYLLSDSLVRRIIVPTTCCTRLVPLAGDLLLHRSFSSIYLKRQKGKKRIRRCKPRSARKEIKRVTESILEEALIFFILRIPAEQSGKRRASSAISGAAFTPALQKKQNTMTFSDTDAPPVICGLFLFHPQRFQEAALWWWVKCGYFWSGRGLRLTSLLCSDTFCLLFAAVLDCLTSPGRI